VESLRQGLIEGLEKVQMRAKLVITVKNTLYEHAYFKFIYMKYRRIRGRGDMIATAK